MTHDICISTSPESGVLRRAIPLIGTFGLLLALLGLALVQAPASAPDRPDSADMPAASSEDWHGNVRRSDWPG